MHRFTYLWVYGGHERKKVLNHGCRESRCCNPLHVEPATPNENGDLRNFRDKHDGEAWWPTWIDQRELPMKLLTFAIMNDLPMRPSDYLDYDFS